MPTQIISSGASQESPTQLVLADDDYIAESIASAITYTQLGLNVFPGPYGQKGARSKGSSTRPGLTDEDAIRHVFSTPRNVIVRTGGEAKLVVVDLDFVSDDIGVYERVYHLLCRRLDIETACFGRPSKPVSQIVVRCPDLPEEFTKDDACGIEIRSHRHLSNFPPSRHPEGEHLQWMRDLDDLADVPFEQLVATVRYIRAVVILAIGGM